MIPYSRCKLRYILTEKAIYALPDFNWPRITCKTSLMPLLWNTVHDTIAPISVKCKVTNHICIISRGKVFNYGEPFYKIYTGGK